MKKTTLGRVLALCLLLSAGSAFAAEAPRGLERASATAAPAATAEPEAQGFLRSAGATAAPDPAYDYAVYAVPLGHDVLDIVQEDGQLLVLVEEAARFNADGTLDVNDDEVTEARIAEGFSLPEGFSPYEDMEVGFRVWREFDGETVGSYTNVLPYLPTLLTVDDPDWLVYEEDGFYTSMNSFPWQVTWNGALVRQGDPEDSQETCGLWLVEAGKEPVLMHTGTYFNPMVVPGEDRVIASKFRSGEGIVYTIIVSVDLNTFEEEHLLVAFPNSLRAYALLDGKVLFQATEEVDSDSAAYGLADPETQAVEQMETAIAEAMASVKQRPLQSTGTPGEYYIAVPAYQEGVCAVGTFNVHTLAFTPLKTLRDLDLDPAATWVDAENGVIYSCQEGMLLAIPFN